MVLFVCYFHCFKGGSSEHVVPLFSDTWNETWPWRGPVPFLVSISLLLQSYPRPPRPPPPKLLRSSAFMRHREIRAGPSSFTVLGAPQAVKIGQGGRGIISSILDSLPSFLSFFYSQFLLWGLLCGSSTFCVFSPLVFSIALSFPTS